MKLNISGVFTTAAKEVLLHQFNCDAEIGKSKMWSIAESPFLNALQNNKDILDNFQNIMQHIDGNVTIKDR